MCVCRSCCCYHSCLSVTHLSRCCEIRAGGATCWPESVTTPQNQKLALPSYLLKSLRPVKDLEQPVSASFSSSTLSGGGEAEAGGRVEEDERREAFEDVDPELNSPSSPLWSGNPPSGTCPVPNPAPEPTPRSRSMTDEAFNHCRALSHPAKDELYQLELWAVLQNLQCRVLLRPK